MGSSKIEELTFKGNLSEHLTGGFSFSVSSVSLVFNYCAARKHSEKPDMLPNGWGRHAGQRVARPESGESDRKKLSSPTDILRTSCALIRKHHPVHSLQLLSNSQNEPRFGKKKAETKRADTSSTTSLSSKHYPAISRP